MGRRDKENKRERLRLTAFLQLFVHSSKSVITGARLKQGTWNSIQVSLMCNNYPTI